jgi:hypothetical protein
VIQKNPVGAVNVGGHPPPKQATAKAPSLSFLKRGQAAQAVLQQEEHKAESRKNQTYRFFLPEGKNGSITFLDGNIMDGVLDLTYYYEHNVCINGKWGNHFICTQDTEPCPICAGGLYPSYVGVATVIDHSSYTSQKDGKTYKDKIQLFVAKRDTLKTLQALAVKRGGLTGWRVDVSRTGEKSAAVGNVFDFISHQTPQQIIATYGADYKPLDYEKVLGEAYLPASELRKLGFGPNKPPVGSEEADPADYANSL